MTENQEPTTHDTPRHHEMSWRVIGCESWVFCFRSSVRKSSDDFEVRRRVQVIFPRVIDDAVEGPTALDAKHLVDAAEREVVTATRFVAAGIRQPRPHADALDEGRRLPRGRHQIGRA